MNEKLLKRSEVPVELTWKLEDVFASVEDWQLALEEVNALSDEILVMEKDVIKSAENLYEGLCLCETLLEKGTLVIGYAHKTKDVDTAASLGQDLFTKAQRFSVKMMENTAFIGPALIQLEEETLEKFYEEKPELKKFKRYITEERRRKPHFLAPELEKILAGSAGLSMLPYDAYGALINADIRFPDVFDAKGEVVKLTNGRYISLMESNDREFRKEVFTKFYETYRSYKNTIATLYAGQVEQLMFYAKNRNYTSVLEASLDENFVSTEVYDNLIQAVHENVDKLHRYIRLRKKLLGLEEIHMYDLFAPVVKDVDKKYTIEEAKELVLKALAPLGEAYVSVVRRAFNERWIDVMENEGKRVGAYSSGMYGTHPYILLNFNGTLDNVFTLAHEIGHTMHSYYSNEAQNYLDSLYSIFVAEVASTTNEILLTEYLLEHSRSLEEKAVILDHYMNSFKSTLYRQTMFAEFEKRATGLAEKGIPLNGENLTELYYELNQFYFGPDMEEDELIGFEWLRIPHFYYNFYVYQYATGYSSAVSIATRILKEGEPVVKSYLEFLKSGCTKDPVSLLKIAGVDMSTKKPIHEALCVFEKVIMEMEELIEKL